MKMERQSSPWASRLVSLLFAILRFTFVQSKNNTNTRTTSPANGASVTSVEVVTDIPISIDVDRDKYFVSGLPETATLRLEGSQSILTQTLATRNFEITTPDLNTLGPGTHVIKLEAKKLSSSLTYSIMPAEVTVRVEEKAVEDHNVSVEFNSSSLAEGYVARKPIVNPETVRISGAKSTIEKISEVSVIVLPDGNNIAEDIEMTLPVLVFDKNGDLLNVNLEPSQVTVTIPVEGTSRNLPLALRQTGEANPEYVYELELLDGERNNVTVNGREEMLKTLENLPVEVDVSGVTESTTRKVRLIPPNGVTIIRPETVEVVIRVKKKTDEDQEEEDTSSEESASDDTTEDRTSENTSSNSADDSDGTNTE